VGLAIWSGSFKAPKRVGESHSHLHMAGFALGGRTSEQFGLVTGAGMVFHESHTPSFTGKLIG
jgi:hypothetical protein